MLYHLDGPDWEERTPPPQDKVRPVLYLSRSTSPIEKRYYAGELEVACLVWTIRKVRHLIDNAARVIVYTDHDATRGIVSHTHLGSSATDRQNLRLIRASQYLSQFNLEVRHRAGTTNLVADALSRLPGPPPRRV